MHRSEFQSNYSAVHITRPEEMHKRTELHSQAVWTSLGDLRMCLHTEKYGRHMWHDNQNIGSCAHGWDKKFRIYRMLHDLVSPFKGVIEGTNWLQLFFLAFLPIRKSPTMRIRKIAIEKSCSPLAALWRPEMPIQGQATPCREQAI